MPAFTAPEETDFAFVGRPELAKPPEREVVLALRALHGNGGKRPKRFTIFDDNDLFFPHSSGDLEMIITGNLPDVPALPALHLAPG